MRTSTAALALAGLFLAPEALAIDDPYMWGVGPRVSTIVVPGRYPITFPDKVDNYNFIADDAENGSCNPNTAGNFPNGDPLCENERRDIDPVTGEPLYHSLERVRGDIEVGGDFTFYLNKDIRVGLMGEVGFGKRWHSIQFLPKVHKVLLEDQIDVYAGGGIGFGYQAFKGVTNTEKLQIPYFPVRVEVGAMARIPTAAFQLGIFAQSSIPGNQTYTTAAGDKYESVGTPLAFASYLSAGIEFTTYFGDFKPPKGGGKKGGKKGGKGGGKKGGGKKGGGKK